MDKLRKFLDFIESYADGLFTLACILGIIILGLLGITGIISIIIEG